MSIKYNEDKIKKNYNENRGKNTAKRDSTIDYGRFTSKRRAFGAFFTSSSDENKILLRDRPSNYVVDY